MRTPLLRTLFVELSHLSRRGLLGPPPGPRACREGDRTRLAWPGAGEFWLDHEQAAVARRLLDAMLDPDEGEVAEVDLLREAHTRKGGLADVFAGCPAWGVLVVPGSGPGLYRLAEPHN